MDEHEIEVLIQTLKETTKRFAKILEGNGVPGIVHRVTQLETNRSLDRKDMEVLTRQVISINEKVDTLPKMYNKIDDLDKQLKEHIEKSEESSNRKIKRDDAVSVAVIIFVITTVLGMILRLFGIG